MTKSGKKEVSKRTLGLITSTYNAVNYTKYPFIRSGNHPGDQPLGFLKNPPISNSPHFLIFQHRVELVRYLEWIRGVEIIWNPIGDAPKFEEYSRL